MPGKSPETRKPLSLHDILKTKPEFEIFQTIKSGKLVPINKYTGQKLACSPEHHEYLIPKPMPEKFSRLLPDLDYAKRCLLGGKSLTLLDQRPGMFGSRLIRYFGCPLSDITLDMVERAMQPILAEYAEYDELKRAERADEPNREKWEHLLLPRNKEETHKLKAYLDDAVFMYQEEEKTRLLLSEDVKENKPVETKDEADFNFYRNGDFWCVGTYGKELHVRDLKGMQYIHCLIDNKGYFLPPKYLFNLIEGNKVTTMAPGAFEPPIFYNPRFENPENAAQSRGYHEMPMEEDEIDGGLMGPEFLKPEPNLPSDNKRAAGLPSNADWKRKPIKEMGELKKIKKCAEQPLNTLIKKSETCEDPDEQKRIKDQVLHYENKIKELDNKIALYRKYLSDGCRTFHDQQEDNARTNIQKAIKLAMRRITENCKDTVFIEELKNIHTGYMCMYLGSAEWRLF